MSDSNYEREWFDRLIEERDQLAEKLDKLTSFLKDAGIGSLLPAELHLLTIQKSYMGLYLSVLEERIERNHDSVLEREAYSED